MLKHPVATDYVVVDGWVNRAWGRYKVIEIGKGFKTKLLAVKPFGRSSEQRHLKRKEVWTYVSGERFGETVEIAPLEWHRLQNDTPVEVFIIETQLGECQETDIERRP